jgi:long-chain acyl-CoA synthetase
LTTEDLATSISAFVGSKPTDLSVTKPAFSARTAGEIWRTRAGQASDAFLVRQGQTWRKVSWQEADGLAREIAAGLIDLGVNGEECVCLLGHTTFEWVLCDLALVCAGAVSVPIYPSSTTEQCAAIIRDSGSRIVISDDLRQVSKLLPLVGQIPNLRLIYMRDDGSVDMKPGLAEVVTAITEAGGAGPTSLEELRRLGHARLVRHPQEPEQRLSRVTPESVFTIVYTSGTTGQPKGVVLTHRNMVEAFASAIRAFDLRDTDVQYLFLPLTHVLGREMEWAPMIAGSALAFSSGPAQIKTELGEIRPTFLAGVPRVLEKLHAAIADAVAQGAWPKRALVSWAFKVGGRYAAVSRQGKLPSAGLRAQHALADRLVLSKLRARLGFDRCRFLICGGAPLAHEIAEFFHAMGLLILEGYGLTETVGAAFVNRWNCHRFGTVGPAVDVLDYRLAEDGEVLMRGPSVFTRYHKNPQATAEAIDPEGWFHSGDIGQIEEGFLRIVDRKKDIIVTAGGKKVAPQMIETGLKTQCPLVSQVVVFGDKRPHCVALVTLSETAIRRFGNGDGARAAISPQARAALAESIEALNRTLASFETIKNFAILPRDFTEDMGEITPSLKVRRDVVQARFASVLNALYEKPV